MAISAQQLQEIIYPDSDGKPMADNTIQYQYIITIQVGLDRLFDQQPDVFVAGDLLWYPVKGRRDISAAPDVMVAFGRPKGDRGSYKQWEEGGLAPQVVFEILSPSNTATEMRSRRKLYARHGVEEYYEYDPDSGTLEIWQRSGDFFRLIAFEGEWRSPRLGVTLKVETDGTLGVYGPDGRRFEKPKDALSHADAEIAEARAEIARLTAKLRELGVEPE
jgi:Uma2 family endonuclease